MPADLAPLSGLLLMFALGLRHGLDPDHIACIDGLTWRTMQRDRRLAPWVGTLFATGHGLLVTAIAVGLARLGQAIEPPEALRGLLDWIPTLLLALVGAANLRQLLGGGSSASGSPGRDSSRAGAGERPPAGGLALVPARLRDRGGAWAIVLVGVLFAAVFDTATQVSAWGFAASGGGPGAALAAGLAFTVGMMLTDTLDGRLLCRLVERPDAADASRRHRLALGWAIVALSFGVVGYNVARALRPALELDEAAWSLVGLGLVLAVLAAWAWSAAQAQRGPRSSS